MQDAKPRNHWRSACLLVILIAASSFPGCESTPTTTGASESSALLMAEQAYRQGAWLKAYDEGTAAEATLRGEDRARAALVAGASAARLGELDRAELFLTTATQSNDRAVRSSALVSRASVREAQSNVGGARRDLEDALPLLSTSEASRVRGELQRLSAPAGSRVAASTVATVKSAEPPPAKPVVAPGRTTPMASAERWVLQAGVFSRRTSATKRVTQLASDCARLKLGTPVIEEIQASGRPAFRVVLGIFSTRENAENARRELGRNDIIVQAEQG